MTLRHVATIACSREMLNSVVRTSAGAGVDMGKCKFQYLRLVRDYNVIGVKDVGMMNDECWKPVVHNAIFDEFRLPRPEKIQRIFFARLICLMCPGEMEAHTKRMLPAKTSTVTNLNEHSTVKCLSLFICKKKLNTETVEVHYHGIPLVVKVLRLWS